MGMIEDSKKYGMPLRLRIVVRTLAVAFCCCGGGISVLPAAAQGKIYRVAILAPLYLDSSFDASGNYRLGTQFPRYATAGLEFTEGARLAFDTMQITGASVQSFMYDVRSANQSVSQLISSHQLDSIQLMIGSVSGSDYTMLASFAGIKNIPFISATYPNEGGIRSNPYVVILNPTLFTHCQAIYHFVVKNHPTHQIIYVRKPGAMEDRLEGYFKQLNDNGGKPLLPIRTVVTGDTVSISDLAPLMDSNRHTVIVSGSLDETWGTSLVRTCNTLLESYPMTLMGMPTWDGIKALQGAELRQMPYLITTPFLSPDIDSGAAAMSMTQRFSTLTNTRPGDMAFRGYESTYLFTSLLMRYEDLMMAHIGETYYQTYTSYDIKPVYLTPDTKAPDYYENKHLYILRRQNGAVMRMD
jgi:hypothetical protein